MISTNQFKNGMHISLDGTRSRSVAGKVVSWDWKIDGAPANGASVERSFTRGGPLGQSMIVSTYAFENALISGALGVGAAVAVVMIPIYLIVLFVAFRLGRE